MATAEVIAPPVANAGAAPGAAGWNEANQRFLSACLAHLRGKLKRHLASRLPADAEGGEDVNHPRFDTDVPADASLRVLERALDHAREAMPSPPALDVLVARFELTPFERDVLLLCAAVDLDASFGRLCALAQDLRAPRAQPTFGLALAVLAGAHWSALLPTAPLRWFELVGTGRSEALTAAPLVIDERVLHALVGLDYLDERLASTVTVVEARLPTVPSQQALAAQLADLLTRRTAVDRTRGAVVQLVGRDTTAKQEIVAAAAGALGLRMAMLPAASLPGTPADSATLARLWTREALLAGRLLYVDTERGGSTDPAALSRFLDRVAVPVVLGAADRLSGLARPVVAVEVARPSAAEQRGLWMAAIDEPAGSTAAHDDAHRAERGALADRLAAHFDLPATTIEAACASVRGRAATNQPLASAIWASARVQARARIDEMAQRIEGAASWDDLVLPLGQRAILRQIAVHVRQRTRVYDTWGFGGRGARGLGISALFAGPSGTGKTLAAEVLARELELDLFRIDLSHVVSKYIGETEKNLRRVFDAAEEGGAVLLFDEADALFGKRTEVKDSHDRFANIEVSYLLQRMETYRGLAILTTNFRSAVDTAFLRRIRFFVQFPFPSTIERAEIWRRIFPARMPAEGLDVERLARLNVSGGTIRNIAMGAAFLAADAGAPVRMDHVLAAARTEYAKLERPLTSAEFDDPLVATPRAAGAGRP